ncbi:major histocompatibility complex class I-related gene protein-like isoform X2 [Echeneis naucrates]|uniref:major histocompatibility complex class I-related gene protein-like isoform X2 n=1 Tax=Echeneis naucrates TaxID=173247 RepID=UPI0011136624|nr:major histocompatibility complex class I-related gene protein-like isoform X2 [Echeneis naucrates]
MEKLLVTFQKQSKMKLFLLLLFCHVSSPEKHFLEFFTTTSSGISNFPEFIGSAVVDGVEQGSYDSDRKKVELKKDQAKEILENLDWLLKECEVLAQLFKAIMYDTMQLFNQTGGVHVLQMKGCFEWDEKTGDVFGLLTLGYDGEDLISFDFKNLKWNALKPEAAIMEMRWNADKRINEQLNNLLTVVFPGLMKICVLHERSIPRRTDRPSVSLLQKSSSSPVSCFATGFYPNKAVLFWRKDGDDLHDNVEEGEILPNPDGTFQKSSDLDLSSVRPEDWGKYECVFQLDGLKDDIITKLDQSVIRTNSVPVPPSEFPVGPVVGGVVGLLLLTACICGLLIWRRRVHGYQRGSRAETDLH